MRRLLVNIGQLAHLAPNGVEGPLRGAEMSDAELLVSTIDSAILVEDSIISRISDTESLVSEYASGWKTDNHRPIQKLGDIEVWDIAGRAVIPGLVDAHSHLIWAGDRSAEVRMAQQGMSYQEIAAKGGGIAKTVAATRVASPDDLLKEGMRRANLAMQQGTSFLESKSGYGLTTQAELKLLDVSNQIEASTPLQMSHTWLGAHAIPHGIERADYVTHLIEEQLPAVVTQSIAQSADVFCEPGWFTVEDTEQICAAAKAEGMDIRLHVDEFQDGGGAALAADLGAKTADHAGHSSHDALAACDENGVMIGFLPGTPYVLGLDHWPPFDVATENEWAWSLATDFNPNCHSLSLPFSASLAVHRCGISPLAALVASSRNPASTFSDSPDSGLGTIREGGPASLNVLWGEEVDGWCLTPGVSPFRGVICNGQQVVALE